MITDSSASSPRLFAGIPSVALLLGLLLVGCSGKGDLVVDPNSGSSNETSLIAVNRGQTPELVRYSEQSGIVTNSAYSDANQGAALDAGVDAIFTSFDKVYLHQRSTGSITVLGLESRKKIGELDGFAGSADSGLCDMAFSNLSQAWVVSFAARKLYLIDAVNLAPGTEEPIDLPGNPTSVGAVGTRVFVGMVMPDGSAQAAILSSNAGVYSVEGMIPTESPVIYIAGNPDNDEVLMLTSGTPGGQPQLHAYDATTLEQLTETAIPSVDMRAMIGQEPNFAAISYDNYLYIAGPESLVRVDTKSRQRKRASVILQRAYPVIAVDYFTDLLYAWSPGSDGIQRYTVDGNELESIPVTDPVTAIGFVRQNQM